MELKTKIQYLYPDKGRRIIAVSDIHAHQEWLEKLLKKISFGKEDILVIVGDMLEKGPENLKTLRYIMDLCREYRVYPLMGNVDAWRLQMLLQEDGRLDKELLESNERMLKSWGSTFITEMCAELGVSLKTLEDVPKARNAILKNEKQELDFIKGLPAILETPCFTFVHGGLVSPKLEENREVPLFQLLKCDEFLNQGRFFDKYVVVGHWPVTLYDARKDSSAPLINEKQKIIGIDGGCGLKRDGQLNALIIEDPYKEEVTFEYYDEFPEAVALTDQEEGEDSINIRYFESEIKILEAGEEFSFAEHLKTGRQLWIYNGFLEKRPAAGETNTCWEYTDYQIPVKSGEKVSVIQKTKHGYLIKKRGVSGWYYGELEE